MIAGDGQNDRNLENWNLKAGNGLKTVLKVFEWYLIVKLIVQRCGNLEQLFEESFNSF